MAAPRAARTVSSSRIATNVRISLIAWILQQEQQVAQAEQTLRISLLRDCRAQVIERTGVVALELARQRAAPERIGVERRRGRRRLRVRVALELHRHLPEGVLGAARIRLDGALEIGDRPVVVAPRGPGDGERDDHRGGDPCPHVRPFSARRSISNAACVDCHFTEARPPRKRKWRLVTAPATASPTNTVPTGFAAVPPSGPATPVIARPQGAPARSQTERTIASAQGALTAPWVRRISAGTPSSSSFARFEYTSTPRSKYADEPGTFVSRWPRSPPVHDSARARVSRRSRRSRPTTTSS